MRRNTPSPDYGPRLDCEGASMEPASIQERLEISDLSDDERTVLELGIALVLATVGGKHEELARRVRATWNACEDIPTDYLEIAPANATLYIRSAQRWQVTIYGLLTALKAAQGTIQAAIETAEKEQR